MNILKSIWHLLFDDRDFDWRTSRVANVWGSWHPYVGFGLDFNFEIVLPHKAKDEEDFSWGPEFRFGFGLLWIDFGFTLPNDDYPNNQIEVLPRYCKECGGLTETMLADRCTGCRELAAVCSCAKPNTGSASGLKLGRGVTLHRTEATEVVED